jgi:hypothetical protein
MVTSTTDQKAFIKYFYSSGGLCVAVGSQYHRDFPVRVAQLRDTKYGTPKQFEEAESVCDRRGMGRKHSASVRTEVVGGSTGDNDRKCKEVVSL